MVIENKNFRMRENPVESERKDFFIPSKLLKKRR